ncbi:MAG: hypothetical protein ACM3N9_07135 [Syntrophothermus sp.]
MTKKILPLLIVSVFIIFSCNNNASKEQVAKADTVAVTVANFVKQADSLVDSAVTIEGVVSHTCKHGGKRMFLIDNNNDSVMVEVIAGGDIAKFDEAIIGSRVKVFGLLREERIDTKYLNEWEAEVLKPQATEEAGIHTGAKGHEDRSKDDKIAQINDLRQQLKASGKDHLSNFSIEATSFKELK